MGIDTINSRMTLKQLYCAKAATKSLQTVKWIFVNGTTGKTLYGDRNLNICGLG